MSKSTRSNAALRLSIPAAALPPVVRHVLDGVVRRAVRADRGAIDTLARQLRAEMVAHADAHLERFDMDAEDVVQNVFVAMFERKLRCPPPARCAVQWLFDTVAIFAQPDLAA